MLEEKIEELIGALEANTEALLSGGGGDPQTADNDNVKSLEESKARIVKAERDMYDENTTATKQPVSKKKTSKKKSSKKKARNTKPALSIDDVKAELVKIDRESAKAVLATFKVIKLTDLPAESYQAAIDEAGLYIGEEETGEDDLFD